jgi:orotate phosphoribosyltransferase
MVGRRVSAASRRHRARARHASLARGRLRAGGLAYHEAMTTLTERETLDLYEKTGALMRGHFRLTSGLHSDIYLQSALVLQHPEHAARLGDALAAPFRADGARTVLAPAIGGILVAHEVARALGVRALFTERESGAMRLRRGFTLSPGERCLVVEDVITTGGSTREVVECVRAAGGAVVGVGSLIDRSGGGAAFDVKRAALATVAAATWPPDSCPLCKAGGQAIKPGSRA